MKYILDAAQMKEVDNYSISTVGIPSVGHAEEIL